MNNGISITVETELNYCQVKIIEKNSAEATRSIILAVISPQMELLLRLQLRLPEEYRAGRIKYLLETALAHIDPANKDLILETVLRMVMQEVSASDLRIIA